MKNKIAITHIQSGSRFTAPLWNRKNDVLLPAYHSVHPYYLEEWSKEGEFVFTDGEIFEKFDVLYGQELPGYIDKETRHLLNVYYESVNFLKTLYQKITHLTLVQLQKIISPWVAYTLTKDNLSSLLKVCRYAIFSVEDYFYIHSIDTMLLSLGIYKQYYQTLGATELTKLASSALLCDIGMFLLPKNLIHTDQIYTEEQKLEIQKHTILGYSFLLTELDFPQDIAQPALEHHERPDGSGYPYGQKGGQLYPNSIIIALADVFASQIHTRTFKDSREPAEILKDFIQTMMPVFPQNYSLYIAAFVSYITIYPATSILKLNTGEVAIVTKAYPQYPTRPKVLLLLDSETNKYHSILEKDLSEDANQHISITGIYTQSMLDSLNIYN